MSKVISVFVKNQISAMEWGIFEGYFWPYFFRLILNFSPRSEHTLIIEPDKKNHIRIKNFFKQKNKTLSG